MAVKRCIKCNSPAYKLVDGRLYCKSCVAGMEMPKKVKLPCSCGCKEVVKKEPKKRSFWKRIFGI